MPRELTYRDTERLLVKLQGTELVLVGGQAVNFWAEQYLEDEPALLSQGPFTSRDIDFFGEPPLVKACARALRCEYRLEDPFAPGPSAGLILFEDDDGIVHPIDFLRNVFGLDISRVIKTRIPVDVLDEQGRVVATSLRVMNPILCLESRVHNVMGLPGAYDTVHGRRQLRASILCARVFLRRLLEVERQRDALNCIRSIFELCIEDPHGRQLYEDKGIDPFDAVEEDPRLPAKFFEQQLPRMRQRLAARRAP